MAGALLPFVPISRQLLDSSVWETDLRVRVLWITMLMVASEPGRRGVIDMTVRSLAGRAAMSPEDVRVALQVLESPDPDSRSTSSDGRRVKRLDEHREWGWRLVNWSDYEDARERMFHAKRQARYKDGKRDPRDAETRTADGKVTPADGKVTPDDVEGEGEVEGEVEEERVASPPKPSGRSPHRFTPPTLDEVRAQVKAKGHHVDPEAFIAFYESKGWRIGKEPMQSWRAALVTWEKRRASEGNCGPPRSAPAQSDLLPLSEWGKNRPDGGRA